MALALSLRVYRFHARPLGLQQRLLTVPAAAPPEGDLAPKPFSEMPGPRRLPVVGNGFDMKANTHRLREYLNEGFSSYGDIYKLKAFSELLVAQESNYYTLWLVLTAYYIITKVTFGKTHLCGLCSIHTRPMLVHIA